MARANKMYQYQAVGQGICTDHMCLNALWQQESADELIKITTWHFYFTRECYLCEMLAVNAWYEMINIWDNLSTFIPGPGIFLSTDILWTIRQYTTDLLYIRFTNQTKYKQNNFSDLSTDSPCGGWFTRLFYGSPFIGLCFENDSLCVILV